MIFLSFSWDLLRHFLTDRLCFLTQSEREKKSDLTWREKNPVSSESVTHFFVFSRGKIVTNFRRPQKFFGDFICGKVRRPENGTFLLLAYFVDRIFFTSLQVTCLYFCSFLWFNLVCNRNCNPSVNIRFFLTPNYPLGYFIISFLTSCHGILFWRKPESKSLTKINQKYQNIFKNSKSVIFLLNWLKNEILVCFCGINQGSNFTNFTKERNLFKGQFI